MRSVQHEPPFHLPSIHKTSLGHVPMRHPRHDLLLNISSNVLPLFALYTRSVWKKLSQVARLDGGDDTPVGDAVEVIDYWIWY